MTKRRKLLASTLLIALAGGVMAGCSSSDSTATTKGAETEKETEASKEPVTLQLFYNNFTKEEFQLLIADPVKAKYPHITVEMRTDGVAKAVTAKEPIDLMLYYIGDFGTYKDLDLLYDLSPLVKNNKFDLNRFDPGALKAITDLSTKGELYALPFHSQFNALYYNKAIFNKFGVAYPPDGMMWEDAIELAKKLTRVDNGTQYYGLSTDVWTRLTVQRSVLPVDAKTMKAAVNSDPFRKAMEVAKQIYSIPGNEPIFSTDKFVKDQTVAMFASVPGVVHTRATQAGMDWDMAQFPSYKDRPNIFTQYDLHIMGISNTSKHKEDAMRVLELFFSDEIQKISTTKTGRVPPMSDPIYQKLYGSEDPALKGKRIASVFKSKNSTPNAVFSKYHSKSNSLLLPYFMEYVKGTKDINTALREAEEAINKWIEANP
ncbi:MAG: transporter substrate-binding protein [Paenibacillus sp.]|nr:transporter substrate-binding protein [Paenibacillus sp.]